MLPPFDIFRIDGALRWLGAASDLHTAKERLKVLGASSPGRYLVFCQDTGEKMLFDVKPEGVLTMASSPESEPDKRKAR